MDLISERFSKILITTGIIIAIIFLASFLHKSDVLNLKYVVEADKVGQFGDAVGGIVGSLWALAGVVLFYINLREQRQAISTSGLSLEKQIEALDMQRVELEIQRKEFERGREGYERQKVVYEEQSRAISVQQFESNFYALLNVYIKIRNNLDALDGEKDFFYSLFSKMTRDFTGEGNHSERFLAARNAYESIYFDNKGRLSHYLKTFYRIVKIIDDSDLSEQQKYFYSKIIRSQLTEHELFILYYNSHIQLGRRFYPLILRYNLLKHLPPFSKLEFKSLSLGLALENSKLLFFQTWLDIFLEENLNVAYGTVDEDAPAVYNRSKECPIVAGLVTELKVETSICIIFHFYTVRPHEQNNFTTFIHSYLLDRLYSSRYEEFTVDDRITVMTGTSDTCAKYSFTLESPKELKINIDTF